MNKELERLNIHIAELIDQGSLDIADILVDYREAITELKGGTQ